MKKLWTFEVWNFSINMEIIFIISGKFRKLPEILSLGHATRSTRPDRNHLLRPSSGTGPGPDQLGIPTPSYPWPSLPSIVAGKARSD
jgi:hypothetical protein